MSTSYTNNYPATGYASETQLRTEFDRLRTALLDTVSRTNSGTGSNAMAADLDMDGNDVLNVGRLDVDSIIVSGQNYKDTLNAIVDLAKDEADRSSNEADRSRDEAERSLAYAQEAKDSSVFLKEFLDDYAQEILNFPLDLGFITDAPVQASYDLGELL